MRHIDRIVIHCSATRHSDAHLDRKFVRQLHVEGNGWSDIGYHWIITRAGVIQKARPLERAGAHAKGFNSTSIGICLMGGLADNSFPTEGFHYFSIDQQLALAWLVARTRDVFPDISLPTSKEPTLNQPRILGHRDLPDVKKLCPTFNVKLFLETVPATMAKLDFSEWSPVMEE